MSYAVTGRATRLCWVISGLALVTATARPCAAQQTFGQPRAPQQSSPAFAPPPAALQALVPQTPTDAGNPHRLVAANDQPPNMMPPQASPPTETPPQPGVPVPDLIVPINQQFYLRPTGMKGPFKATDISIDRPDMMLPYIINPKNESEVVFQAIKLGYVRITFFDNMDPAKYKQYVVRVVPDVIFLNGLLRERFRTANLNVVAAGDNVLFVEGVVDNPNDVNGIDELLRRYFTGGVVNNVRVGGVMQVQLDVVIARVDRAELRRLGVNALGTRQNAYFGTQVGNLIGPPPLNLAAGRNAAAATFNPLGTAGPVLNGAPTGFFGLADKSGGIYFFIEALRQKNLAKILANPTLVTFNGRQADFLVGGEQPIPVAAGLGTQSVNFKPFGTRLTFLPTIMGDGKIRLDVVPEVSSVNTNTLVNGVGQFITQRLHATVELQSGQTLVLGGLLQTDTEAQVEKVPVLGDIPLAGALFRRVRHRVTETELLVVITPRLFDPLRDCQAPAVYPGQETQTPPDAQLFGKGRVEVPAPSRGGPRLGDEIAPVQPSPLPNTLYPGAAPAPAGGR